MGNYFGVPAEKLAAIDRENVTGDQRRITLLDCWEKPKLSVKVTVYIFLMRYVCSAPPRKFKTLTFVFRWLRYCNSL